MTNEQMLMAAVVGLGVLFLLSRVVGAGGAVRGGGTDPGLGDTLGADQKARHATVFNPDGATQQPKGTPT